MEVILFLSICILSVCIIGVVAELHGIKNAIENKK